jgi:hypothetical protein
MNLHLINHHLISKTPLLVILTYHPLSHQKGVVLHNLTGLKRFLQKQMILQSSKLCLLALTLYLSPRVNHGLDLKLHLM